MGPKMLKETRDGMMTVLPSGWQDCVTQLRHSPPPSWLLRWSVTPRETRLVDQMIDCVNKKFDMFDWVHPFWWENTNRLGTSLLSLSKSRASSNCFWLKPSAAPRQWYWSNTPHPRGRINLIHPGFRGNKICQQHLLQSEACAVPNHSNVCSVDIHAGMSMTNAGADWLLLGSWEPRRRENWPYWNPAQPSPAQPNPAQPSPAQLRCPNLMSRSDCYGRVQPRNIAPLGNLWNTETMEVVLQSHLGCRYCTY